MGSDRLTFALAATERLRLAVLGTRTGIGWLPEKLHLLEVVRQSAARWATDAGTTFTEFDKALKLAVASPDRDEAPDHDPIAALEDAIVRAVALRDRLRSLAALVLGTKCLVLDSPSIRFQPNESDLRRRLSELAALGRSRRAGGVSRFLSVRQSMPQSTCGTPSFTHSHHFRN